MHSRRLLAVIRKETREVLRDPIYLVLVTPSILFSGLLTPVSSMEPSAQVISRFIPASYFITMVRGVFLKGLGFRHYAYDLLTLGAFAAVVYSVAILGFRKRAG